jgi:hypothetical protein
MLEQGAQKKHPACARKYFHFNFSFGRLLFVLCNFVDALWVRIPSSKDEMRSWRLAIFPI